MSIASYEPLSLAGLPWPVELRHHPRARYLRLRLDEERGLLRLTVPKRVSRRAALIWVRGQSAWVDAQLAAMEPSQPFAPGSSIPFMGEEVQLAWSSELRRAPRLAQGVLSCGGPRESFGARIGRWLRDQAREALTRDTFAIATSGGVGDGPVSVGDASTRWGSCSSSGAIRYNWRLILAPPDVRRYVVAHEVAHRVHLNHGALFHELQERLYDGPVAEARSALRRLGPRLKRVGRGN